jgi:hypothetical protein
LETVHEEDCDTELNHHHNTSYRTDSYNNNKSIHTDDSLKTSKYTLNFAINNNDTKLKQHNEKYNVNSQLYEQLNQLKPLGGIKNYKTTKNIFLNDDSNIESVPATTTTTSVVLSTPSQTSLSTSLKRSHQFIAPLMSPNKHTVRFNDDNNSNTSSRDSIASNDSNDTIIEADISSLSNLDSFSNSTDKKGSKSDFLDQQQTTSNMFYFNPDNLSFTLHPPSNITRRNSMPAGSILPNSKRNSLNVTDL